MNRTTRVTNPKYVGRASCLKKTCSCWVRHISHEDNKLVNKQVNLGIDKKGGTIWQVWNRTLEQIVSKFCMMVEDVERKARWRLVGLRTFGRGREFQNLIWWWITWNRRIGAGWLSDQHPIKKRRTYILLNEWYKNLGIAYKKNPWFLMMGKVFITIKK